jgi:poly(beta-D-mannuronate) lyase
MESIIRTLLVLIVSSSIILSQNVFVNDDEQLKSTVNTAQPGDTITIRSGIFDTDGSVTIRNNGTAERPIVIKSEMVGGTELINESYFDFRKCSYITLSGFIFSSKDVTAVKLQASHHIRITNNVFRIKETESVKWVLIGGIWNDSNALSYENKIDHNIFENKTYPGNYITIDGTGDPTYLVSQRDTIEFNYFRNNTPRAENEKESIRIGWSEMSLSSGYTIVQYNLFEDCNGDPEIISVKTCDNTIRYNTFRRSKGTLSLRHGDRNLVYGNFFLGENVEGTGGIRVYGNDHKIFNNYFEGLTGTKWDAPLTLTNGDYDGSSANSKHARINNVTIAFNTLVNNSNGIEIGYTNNNKYSKPPRNVTIANNIITGTENEIVKVITSPQSFAWQSNIFNAVDSLMIGIDLNDSEMRIVDPLLESNDDIFRPGVQSPVFDAATGEWSFINEDIDGQQRTNINDIGADERSNEIYKNKVLDSLDVGPIYENITSVKSEVVNRKNSYVSDYGIYPNPFNASTRIKFTIHKRQKVNVAVYDILGNMISELVNTNLSSGTHTFDWNSTASNSIVSSGVYLIVANFDTEIFSQKVIHLK